jgi:hypothetical protein
LARFDFTVLGSKGDPYKIIFEIEGDRANAYCSCQAGQSGQYCKHRITILSGDLTYIVSENAAEASQLHDLLQGTDLMDSFDSFLKAEALAEEAKENLDSAKRDLARAMFR